MMMMMMMMMRARRLGAARGWRRLSQEHGTRPGLHKSPITDHLWQLRERVKAQQREQAERAEHPRLIETTGELKPLAPERTEVLYDFGKNVTLREQYVNPFGTIRVGRVVEDLDALAGNVAHKHCSQGGAGMEKVMLVTASIDRVVLRHRANVKDDIVLRGHVSWVGSTSMEISMEACSTWTDEPWLTAQFTFVARDTGTGTAVRIPPLAPETPADLKQFDAGAARAAQRKALRKSRECTTIVQGHVKEMVMAPKHASSQPQGEGDVTIEQAVDALLADSRPRLLMPAIGLQNRVRLAETALSNTLIMQPQQRNTAGRIFGGFLVRRAYELAFSTAYLFAGAVPRFREIDDVSFRKPVDVGDLVHLKSSVLFTSTALHGKPSVHVEVLAHVINPAQNNTDVSNSFNFTFEVPAPPEGAAPLLKVVPETREDALRIVDRYFRDVMQQIADDDGRV